MFGGQLLAELCGGGGAVTVARHCCAGGLHADIVADGGASLNSAQQQLVLMNGMIFGELGVLIGLTEKFATVSGKTQRVSERENICAHSTVGEPR
eukprot:COSAG01_NODE_4316_length_5136_cov_2.864087_7_plen_95_part_00